MIDIVSSDDYHPLKHLAIIMDGNNRWASLRGLTGISGHKAGVERIREILSAAKSHGIEVVSLFAFSSENWHRPASEVSGLINLFTNYLSKEIDGLKTDGVRLKIIGNKQNFSNDLCRLIKKAEEQTADGHFTLVLCVDYGGRWDIIEAARQLAFEAQSGEFHPETISEEIFSGKLQLGELPDPDLCIRTGGEERISNFLLWHLAYTELYVSNCFWPDFGPDLLERAIDEYYSRKRRFGHRNAGIDHKASNED
ncbi:MAG: di-trans,poly-cis-decaprenylcistransferase [Cellvibrionales bacterium TMED148]|nr:di-trans,poly-cis-decaprenylcistransferase [Porticoccaceae bacterium]RPG89636.1 MAG: di-trans,poly-cis-decaprenylcistransferase [Cellvibrionales bacterium TMED148]